MKMFSFQKCRTFQKLLATGVHLPTTNFLKEHLRRSRQKQQRKEIVTEISQRGTLFPTQSVYHVLIKGAVCKIHSAGNKSLEVESRVLPGVADVESF